VDYLLDVLFEFSLEDGDVAAFVKPTSIIGGRDAVEEFLACGISPVSYSCGFEVETKETPLLSVVVPKPLLGQKRLNQHLKRGL
jgi:hypothetical protein